MSKNILILSDSLASPLFKKNQNLVNYIETWPYFLKKERAQDEIAQSSIVSATMVDMVRQAEYWKPFFPDLTIVQVGLNDCQPRILKLYEKIFLSQSYVGRSISSWMAKHGVIIRKIRKLTYTKKTDFRQSIKDLKTHSKQILWLSIICHPDIEVARLPNLRQLIHDYNQILRQEVGEDFLDLSDLKAEHFTIDYLHLSPEGHKEVFKRILERL